MSLKIGYTLSSEEFDPITLTKNAKLAEESGFDFLSISDHFHPWVDEQGQSPFVWSVLGAISQVTKKVEVIVGVTCPIIRIHPAIVAQAAATIQYMLGGRFSLGLGSGENLNEHIVGHGWPPVKIRLEMLEEAIEIMRKLWQGGYQDYFGEYFSVDAARIYTLPDKKIPIIFSSFGSKSAELAGKLGDGFITTSPDKKLVDTFKKGKSSGAVYGQLSVCFAKTEEEAKKIVQKEWPLAGMPKPLNTELRLPKDFEATAKLVRVEDATESVNIGPQLNGIKESIKKYKDAGFDHIYIHNIGPYQEEFMKFASHNLL